jgi:RecA-family ATPase
VSLPDPEWLIEDVLPKGGNAMLWGDSNVGKTFTALDIGARVATGLDWMGYETKQGHVLYVAAEGASFFKNRIHAWEQVNKLNLSEHMSFLTEAVQLADPRAVDQFNSVVLDKKEPPSLVVLDTLHRCFVGKDENSSKDAGSFWRGWVRQSSARPGGGAPAPSFGQE